jgi:hypothetical protein
VFPTESGKWRESRIASRTIRDMGDPESSNKRSFLMDPALVVSVFCFVCYCLISRVVLNLFPFSTYSMYSSVSAAHQGDVVRGCHLLAVGPDGCACDVTEFISWECPAWEDAARQSVTDLSCPIDYNVEDPIREHIRRHTGTDPRAVRVDLVRRVWEFSPRHAATQTDHVVATCRAVLK